MGICCCKAAALSETEQPRRTTSDGHHGISSNVWRCSCLSDVLVLEALEALRRLADNEEEPPECMTVLHALAEEENGWLEVVRSCVFAIPLEFVLGAAIVSLLLDECPLPTKDGINTLMERLNLSADMTKLSFTTQLNTRESELTPAICRNIAVVLGCLADKLAGPTSIAILNKGTLQFLMSKLNNDEHSAVVLFSILALEKFAQTSENKVTIQTAGISNALLQLEEYVGCENHLDHQVGFCAQWSLDNIYPVESRKYSYENIDLSEVNAVLNSNDVSEYLKISPSGLEARCDASSFESVRCTFCVESGVWFYEVTVLTGGVMQIGWATKQSKFLNHEGYGIGDDEFSCAYDGCRQLIWHAAHSTPHTHPPWKPGDILGLVLDLDHGKLLFYLNGCEAIERDFKIPSSGGFFAAASFMSFQHCQFNFGHAPFMFPPSFQFEDFNSHATLSAQEKIVLPRPLKIATLRQESVQGDPCKICFEKQQDTYLTPCGHGDMCMACALQLEACPICRQQIDERCLQQLSPMSESYSFDGS